MSPTWKHLEPLLIAALVFVLLTGLREWGMLKEAELTAYDLLYPLAAPLRPASPPGEPKITLVWIDDEAERRFGAILSDGDLAGLLEKVLANGARLVGVDLYRDRPVLDRQGEDGRGRLERVLRDHDNVVAIYLFQGIEPPAVLRGSDRIGFADFVYDEGGIIRRGLLNLDDGENLYFSFALVLALHYLAPQGIGLAADQGHPDNWRLGDVSIAPITPDFGGYVGEDARGFQYLLDYTIDERRFRQLTLTQVVDGDFSRADFQDRIVIIGNRTRSSKDFFFTPVSRWRAGDQRVFGATAHAIATAQLVDIGQGTRRPLRTPGNGWEYAWLLLWTLAGVAAARFLRTLWLHTAAILAGLATLLAAALWGFLQGWWIPLVPPALGFVAAAGLLTLLLSARERRERREIMQLFARRVSPPVAELYWQQRERLFRDGRLPPQKLTATVLFTDLKNFTKVSEHADPAQLMEWLNDYMESMVDAVFAHGGHLDKMIGDAVMAVFGVPFGAADKAQVARDANAAVACAVEMARRVGDFNALWTARGFPPIGMRVGIFTGELVAGTLGSAQRQEYTVIGDTVNTASRLESFDKTLGEAAPCRILVGEPTMACLDDRFRAGRVGEVALKGKQQPVTVYMVEV